MRVPRSPRHAAAAVAVILAMAAGLAELQAQSGPRRELLRVAFTSVMFAGVNVNDARAALSVFADMIAGGRGLHFETETEIFDDVDALGRALDAGRIHLAAMSTEQYRRLRRPAFGSVLLGGRRGRYQEEFLLLVKKGGVTKLADLKGRTLATVDGFSHAMSLAWLDTILLEAGLGPAAAVFGSITKMPKPARAVLPVFFGQQDACLISRYGYELMVELNPQIGTVLAPLAESAPVLHAVLLFDRRYVSVNRQGVIESMLTLHESPRGQQVLSMFGIDRMMVGSPADLAPALALLARRDQLLAGERR